MDDKVEEILHKAYEEGIHNEVLKESSKLEGYYYTYGDKIEIAYNNVKENKIKENGGNK